MLCSAQQEGLHLLVGQAHGVREQIQRLHSECGAARPHAGTLGSKGVLGREGCVLNGSGLWISHMFSLPSLQGVHQNTPASADGGTKV